MAARAPLMAGAGLIAIASADAATGDVFGFRLSPQSGLFTGHFEGTPILPGVGHLAMVVAACARRSNRKVALGGVIDLRFKRPLRPGDEVEVRLTEAGDPLTVRFEIRCGGQLASRGVLTVRPSDDASA